MEKEQTYFGDLERKPIVITLRCGYAIRDILDFIGAIWGEVLLIACGVLFLLIFNYPSMVSYCPQLVVRFAISLMLSACFILGGQLILVSCFFVFRWVSKEYKKYKKLVM